MIYSREVHGIGISAADGFHDEGIPPAVVEQLGAVVGAAGERVAASRAAIPRDAGPDLPDRSQQFRCGCRNRLHELERPAPETAAEIDKTG